MRERRRSSRWEGGRGEKRLATSVFDSHNVRPLAFCVPRGRGVVILVPVGEVGFERFVRRAQNRPHDPRHLPWESYLGDDTFLETLTTARALIPGSGRLKGPPKGESYMCIRWPGR